MDVTNGDIIDLLKKVHARCEQFGILRVFDTWNNAYLCGGFIRDALMSPPASKDVDVFFTEKLPRFESQGFSFAEINYFGGEKYVHEATGMSFDSWVMPRVESYLAQVPLKIQRLTVDVSLGRLRDLEKDREGALSLNGVWGLEDFQKAQVDKTLYVNNFSTLRQYANVERAFALAEKYRWKLDPAYNWKKSSLVSNRYSVTQK